MSFAADVAYVGIDLHKLKRARASLTECLSLIYRGWHVRHVRMFQLKIQDLILQPSFHTMFDTNPHGPERTAQAQKHCLLIYGIRQRQSACNTLRTLVFAKPC